MIKSIEYIYCFSGEVIDPAVSAAQASACDHLRQIWLESDHCPANLDFITYTVGYCIPYTIFTRELPESLPVPLPDLLPVDYIYASWLISLSDWAISERILRFKSALSAGMLDPQLSQAELMVLYGEQARRIALANIFTLTVRMWNQTGLRLYTPVCYTRVRAFCPQVMRR